MDDYAQTEHTRVRRLPQRATYDRATIHAILDDVLIAHVGFVDGGRPFVLPMAFVRVGESIFLHGSTRARMLALMSAEAPVCATVTALDGLVLARSAFHHSMNYRCVSILGRGRVVDDEALTERVLRALTEKIAPGRWRHIRAPNAQELKATALVELPIEEVSGKVRSGPPLDDAEDLPLDVWAGIVPLAPRAHVPEADPQLAANVEVPEHVRALLSRWS